MTLRPVSMDFNYGASFGERSPSAYETLLLDAIIGDATLYTRQDMVEASWRAVQPILDYWGAQKFRFSELRGGNVGSGGGGCHAGAARTCMEDTVKWRRLPKRLNPTTF